MKGRVLGTAMLAGAILLYLGVALPTERQASAAADDFRRLREERREVRSRLQRLERRDAVRRRAPAVEGERPEETVRRLRRAMVDTLRGVRVSSVRLSVRAGRPPVGAYVRLSGQGGFQEVMKLTAQVARPETGVVLDSVRITPGGPGAQVVIEGLALGAAP